MGKWNINELDKNKTEQSIANEEARLKLVQEAYNKLDNELERYLEESNKKLNDMKERLRSLEESYRQGSNFINECNKHLREDF
jgi:archaellum component FlaC